MKNQLNFFLKVTLPIFALFFNIKDDAFAQSYGWTKTFPSYSSNNIALGAPSLDVTNDNNYNKIFYGLGRKISLNPNDTSIKGTEYFLAKYDSSGNYVWSFTMTPVFINYSITGMMVRTDNSNNIYITGAYQREMDMDPSQQVSMIPAVQGTTQFIAKYTPDGTFLWAHSIATDFGMELSFASSGDMDIDNNGNIVVAGSTHTSTFGDLGFMFYYDSDGNAKWFNFESNAAHSVKFDQTGNILLTGNTSIINPPTYSSSIWVRKYTPLHNLVWEKNMPCSVIYQFFNGYTNTYATSIELDNDGNIYLAGNYNRSVILDPNQSAASVFTSQDTTSIDFFFAKYDENMNYKWGKSIGEMYDDYIFDMEVSGNNLVMTGKFSGTLDFDPGSGVVNKNDMGFFEGCGFFSVYSIVNGGYISSIRTQQFEMMSVKNSIINTAGAAGPGTFDLDYESPQGTVVMGGYPNSSGLYLAQFELPACNVNISVSQNAGSLHANASGSTFQWMDCSSNAIVPGATSSHFTPPISGSYKVIVSSNGCIDTSDCYSIQVTNINEVESDNYFSLYPNPARKELNISCNINSQIFEVQISDITGRILKNKTKNDADGKVIVNVEDLKSGVYFLKVLTQDKKYSIFKFIKL